MAALSPAGARHGSRTASCIASHARLSKAPGAATYNPRMDSSWMDAVLAWIGNHPILAGAVIFAIAFCDALIVVGAIVPALPLLFAVGVLIGMGEISGPYAVACASLGAFLGDGLSFWIGRRWGRRLYGFWPFRRYPQLLDRGEILFRRNAVKAILAARYVGAVRPFVPAIAGMAKMPLRRWFIASAWPACRGACCSGPGLDPGRAYDAVAAVAGHLVIVLGLLAAVLAVAQSSRCSTPTAGSPTTPTRCWPAHWTGRTVTR